MSELQSVEAALAALLKDVAPVEAEMVACEVATRRVLADEGPARRAAVPQ